MQAFIKDAESLLENIDAFHREVHDLISKHLEFISTMKTNENMDILYSYYCQLNSGNHNNKSNESITPFVDLCKALKASISDCKSIILDRIKMVYKDDKLWDIERRIQIYNIC